MTCERSWEDEGSARGETMPAITSFHVAKAVLKLVAEDAPPALVGNLIMGNLVNRNYEPVLAQTEDVVWIETRSHTCRLKHIEASFQVPDVTKVLTVPDLLKSYMRPAVEAIAEKIETDLLGLYGGFTANAPVGTPGTAITEPVVHAAETALAKVPANQLRYLLVDSDAYSGLEQMPGFRPYPFWLPTRAAAEYYRGFLVFRSQFVPKTGSSPATTHNLAFGRDAIGLVIRRLPQPIRGTGVLAEFAEIGNFGMRVMISYQPHSLTQQFTLDMLYGAAVIRPEFGVQVLS